MSRPELNESTAAQDFLDFYWLKSELVTFCRANKLPTSGSKADLTQRIAHYLETGVVLPVTKTKPSHKAIMPKVFTKATVIGEGWRCSQELRHFFEQEAEIKFHFNGFMRDFITNSGVDHTLEEALEGWHTSKRQPKGSREIDKQFEYNQHMREFYKANPGAKREEAIQSWKEKRSKRASTTKT